MGTFERFQEIIFKNKMNYVFTEVKREVFINCFLDEFNREEIDKYLKQIHNIYNKRYRIRKKISKWKDMYFITLTFDNNNINKAERTIEDKIREIFKNTNYIACEDYGKKTNRKHYHVLCDENVDIAKTWKWGYYLKLKVNNKDDDKERLNRYMTKITNHNIKKGVRKLLYGNRKKTKSISNT